MYTNRQPITLFVILTFIALMVIGCGVISTATPNSSSHVGQSATPAPAMIESPNPAYEDAQATIDFSQGQLMDLSRRATEVSLNMSQAANDAAQATQDYNQRQKMDLDYQATVISLNIALAEATQNFILQQTKMAGDITSIAQSRAATATYLAYLVKVTQTARAQAMLDSQDKQTAQVVSALTAYPLTATYQAHQQNITETFQAQVILNARATQSAQAIASLTAYPMTATPLAITQAALLMTEYGREQQSFVDQVVIPVIPIIAVLDLALFIVVIVVAYRQSMPRWWPRRLRIAPRTLYANPLLMIDGKMVDPDLPPDPIVPTEQTPANPPMLQNENSAHVEIVDPSQTPFAHWIVELEEQLAAERRQ